MKGKQTTCSRIIGMLMMVAGFTLAWGWNAHATVTTASGSLNAFQVVTADDTGNTTTSLALVQVPDMSVTFNVKKRGPMVVQFCAVIFDNNGANGPDSFIQMVAQVDGVNIPPGEVDFAHHTEVIDSRCYMWVEAEVSSGPHTVRMMWRLLNTEIGGINQRTMFIQYKR